MILACVCLIKNVNEGNSKRNILNEMFLKLQVSTAMQQSDILSFCFFFYNGDDVLSI